ncbi:MAG: hypothetical protein JNM12_12485 [Alphaproteobacteria bacterium]|nr:hypothetical protein [Alphaproteobacteria bacterium]
MALNTVTNQFLAALGIEHAFERATVATLAGFHLQLLKLYCVEAKIERARLMRQNPLDYQALRAMDRELEEVACLLREIEMEQRLA